MDVATFVFLARRLGLKNATQKAAQRYNLDHRSVQRVLKGAAASGTIRFFEKLQQELTRRGGKEVAERLLAQVASVYDIK